MQLEVVRELSEWLLDTTHGVEAKLATLPVDSGVQAPQKVLVVDGTKDHALAKGEQVARGTDLLVLVMADGPTLLQGEKFRGSVFSVGRIPIGMTVAHRGPGEAATKVQDALHVLRALTLSVEKYFEQAEAARTRNEVVVLDTAQLQVGLVTDDGNGALGAVVFTVRAFDKRAQRTT